MVQQFWVILKEEIAQVAEADADCRNASQRVKMNGRRSVRTAKMRWHLTGSIGHSEFGEISGSFVVLRFHHRLWRV